MKLTGADVQKINVGNFAFSGVRPEKLGASEYTLVTMVEDITGSLSGYEQELLNMKQAIINACQKNPRVNNLMVRSIEFNQQIKEEHGFVELPQINSKDYKPIVCGGTTALYDATLNAVSATNEYAKILSEQEFGVNGVVFVITDGDDNASLSSVKAVANEVSRGVQNEYLESLNVILIGVNASKYMKELEDFRKNGNLTQYIDVGDVTPSSLAKLAQFISKSISSQSQSLGTGGASMPIVF